MTDEQNSKIVEGDIMVHVGTPPAENASLDLSPVMPTPESIRAEYPAILAELQRALAEKNPDQYGEAMQKLLAQIKSEIVYQRGHSELFNSLVVLETRLPYLDPELKRKIESGEDLSFRSNAMTGSEDGGAPFGTGSFAGDRGESAHAISVVNQIKDWFAPRAGSFITVDKVTGRPYQQEPVSPIQAMVTLQGFDLESAH